VQRPPGLAQRAHLDAAEADHRGLRRKRRPNLLRRCVETDEGPVQLDRGVVARARPHDRVHVGQQGGIVGRVRPPRVAEVVEDGAGGVEMGLGQQQVAVVVPTRVAVAVEPLREHRALQQHHRRAGALQGEHGLDRGGIDDALTGRIGRHAHELHQRLAGQVAIVAPAPAAFASTPGSGARIRPKRAATSPTLACCTALGRGARRRNTNQGPFPVRSLRGAPTNR